MLTLHALLSDNAVLQRGQPLRIHGTADAGAPVAVAFAGDRRETRADAQGAWAVTFGARDAGGPCELRVRCGTDELVRRDLYVGDVWVCSGQSNMDWPLAQSSEAEAELFGARFPELHLCMVPRRPSLQPESDLDTRWMLCTPQNAQLFSAVSYHFARRLLPELGCHIGLIHCAWGGTDALPWTPRAAIAAEPTLADALQRLDGVRAFAPAAQLVAHPDTGNEGEGHGWAEPACDDAAWPVMDLPCYWQQRGLAFNGAVWFRRTVMIPLAWAGRSLRLHLGVIDDFDTTYFNGAQIGAIGPEHCAAWCAQRSYMIAPAQAQSGRAVIAVRVFDHMGEGGIIGPAPVMHLCVADDPAQSLMLAGPWRYQVERAIPLPPTMDPVSGVAEGHAIATGLFNGMIAPLTRFPVRGFLWYQGENDTCRAYAYQRILPALIRGWRLAWGREDLQFYIVQLPGYRPPSPAADDEWPELRDAQALTTARVPHVDYVVTLDCGDYYDIHPRNKRTVGDRLARLALVQVYSQTVPHRGPRYLRHAVEGSSIRVWFAHTEPQLRTADGCPPRGFTIAGADQQFHPATVTIDADMVCVACPAVPAPVAVRYAWCAAPVVNLQNADSLPAAPFRTDDWPYVTAGRR